MTTVIQKAMATMRHEVFKEPDQMIILPVTITAVSLSPFLRYTALSLITLENITYRAQHQVPPSPRSQP